MVWGEEADVESTSTEKEIRIKKLSELPSRTGDGSVINLHRAIYMINRSLQGGDRKHKERDLKIIAASLQSAMKSKKGTSSSSAAPAAEIMDGITGHQTFKTGSYIFAMFTHKEESVKMHLGQITGMTNRPGGGAKAVKWRLEVDRGAIPDSLWLRCAWFLPHVPSDNPDGFDRITTPFFSWDPSKVVDENIQEFQAKKIVECFDVTVTKDGFFHVPEDILKYVLEYRDLTIKEHSLGSDAPKTNPKKRGCDSSVPAEEKIEEVKVDTSSPLTHSDIARGGVTAVLVQPGNHPGTIVRWEEIDQDPENLEDIETGAEPAEPVYTYYVKYDRGGSADCVRIEDLKLPPSGKRMRRSSMIHLRGDFVM
jgi:hypothetical protein